MVVLPTPPEPQQTMMPVAGSASRASMPMLSARCGPPARRATSERCCRCGRPSAHPLADQLVGEHGDAAVLDAAREHGQGEGGQALTGDLER